MDPKTLVLVLDIALVISALLALFFRPRIGGQLSVGLRLLMVGVLILGITHLIDTLINYYVPAVTTVNRSLLHRSLNLVGFVFIFIGFFRMSRAINA